MVTVLEIPALYSRKTCKIATAYSHFELYWTVREVHPHGLAGANKVRHFILLVVCGLYFCAVTPGASIVSVLASLLVWHILRPH